MLDGFWAQEIDEYKTEPIYNEQQELHPLAQFRDVQEYARKAKVSLTGYGTGRLQRERERESISLIKSSKHTKLDTTTF